MSTNIQIRRVCEHCGNPFLARTTVTRYCSHKCNQRAYKLKEKKEKIQRSALETKSTILKHDHLKSSIEKEVITVKELAIIISVSERTLFRMIKDDQFPKMKLGRSLLFHKDAVINYLTNKYGMVCEAY